MVSETIELLVPARGNFLVQECSGCGTGISIDAGDVLFGGRWYHRACWNQEESVRAPGAVVPERKLDGDRSKGLNLLRSRA